MTAILKLLSVGLFAQAVPSMAVLLPRDPRGGGHGSGGGGHGESGGSSGSGGGGNGGVRTHVGSTFSSGSGRGLSGDTGFSSVSTFDANAGGRKANYFGGGGGQRFTLSDSSVFKGREMGGGLRANVAGTSSYGSGYPYSSRDVRQYGVVGQPFPFGFFPIYWTGHGRSDEYGGNETVESGRPGGDQALVQLRPSADSSLDSTTLGPINQTLWMIGDTQSVTALVSVLADPQDTYTYGCGVEKLSVDQFNSSSPLSPVRFENVIQWYRSSSFALAYTGYNNTYALPPLNQTAGLGWNDSIPHPATLISSPFLQCINKTIIAALPILDQAPASPPISTGEVVGIIIGFVVAIILSCLCAPPGRRMLLAQKRAFQARRSRTRTALPSSQQDASPTEVPTQPDEKAPLSEKQSLLSPPDSSSSLPGSTTPGSEGGRRGSSDYAPTQVIRPLHA
jgi:hypothetical protein